MKFPLRAKLILAVCLPLLAVYLTILMLEYRGSKREALKQLDNYLTEVTAHEAIALDQQLSPIAQVARSTAQFLQTFPHRDGDELEQLARVNLLAEPQIFGIGVALESPATTPASRRLARYVCRSADGRGLRSIDITSVGYDYARSDWFLLPKLLRRPAWTDPYYDEGLGRVLMCSHAVPLLNRAEFEGVVVADVSLAHVRRQLSSARFRGEYRFIISRTGTFVYHPNESFVMAESIFSVAEWYRRPDLADLGRQMIAGGQGVVRIRDFETGQPKWFAFANVPTVSWTLAAVIPEEEVLAPVLERLRSEMCLLLGGLGMILCIVVLVSGWITRPLQRLATAARSVAQGDLEVQVKGITHRDEIGQFAATFNKMVTDLKTSVEAKIRETNARQAIERELQVARHIQTSLLPMRRPPFPDRHEFSLHADNEPAFFMAGDFFDFWLLDDQHLAVVIADVSGKGVSAAMFMAVARTTLRNFSGPSQTPRDVLNIANKLLAAENEDMMFVTVFYGRYHIPTGDLVFANAGHNAPYLARCDGQVECLEPSTGPMLGVFPDADYENAQAVLRPGDLLLLYTDGVTEARDQNDKLLGDEGLVSLLKRIHAQPVDAVCQTILREVNEYRRHEGQDDVTLVALRRSISPAPSA